MKFTLASGNSHKKEELQKHLGDDVFLVENANETLKVIEDGETLQENALKKAVAYFEKYQSPVLADDSGLLVDALPGELGVNTARFGGEGLSDKERCEKLIDALKDKLNRKAQFACTLCFYLNHNEVYYFIGELSGTIANELKGEGGFGYDPVFIPDEAPESSCLAEIPEWKYQNSHRYKACLEARNFFKNRS